MKTTNLLELRTLRNQEKAIKARILEITDAATSEAVAILAAKGLTKGEFTINDHHFQLHDHHFQLQRTDVFNFADFRSYKDENAVKWRAENKKKQDFQNQAKACTSLMNGYVKSFVNENPDHEPDEIQLTVKILD